jgi:N-glycosidase YbiA
MNDIRFNKVCDDYGCLSNFAPYPIEVAGKLWPTSEHYFQAQKFDEIEHQEAIRAVKSPMIAARIGRDRNKKLRPDWESIKLSVMESAVRAKCTQHRELRAILLATGDAKLIEHTERDSYWGDGGDGSGQNMLGKILMRIRAELRDAP